MTRAWRRRASEGRANLPSEPDQQAEPPIVMLGAIAGDIVGSVHEGAGTKIKDSPLLVPRSTFTDDSVLTVAIAEWILTGQNLVDLLHSYSTATQGAATAVCFTSGP